MSIGKLMTLGLLGVPLMHAVIIYNNGGPNGTSSSFTGNEMTHWIEADSFLMGATHTVTGVEFWEMDREDVSAYQGSIDWFIYSDAAGAPGATLASGSVIPTRTPTGLVSQGVFVEFDVTFSIPGFLATGGTQYWLGLHNGPISFTTNKQFFWEQSVGGTPPPGRDLDLSGAIPGWSNNLVEHAFNLSEGVAAVPEPVTGLLFGCGLAGVALIRRRRSR